MIQNCQTNQVFQIFGCETKFSVKIYAFMHLCIIITALLHLFHFLSLHKSLVYSPFVYILYDVCSEDVTGQFSSVKYQWRNSGGTVCAIAPLPVKKSCPFYRNTKMKFSIASS